MKWVWDRVKASLGAGWGAVRGGVETTVPAINSYLVFEC